MQSLSKAILLAFDMPNLELLALTNHVPGFFRDIDATFFPLHVRLEHLPARLSRIRQYLRHEHDFISSFTQFDPLPCAFPCAILNEFVEPICSSGAFVKALASCNRCSTDCISQACLR